MKKLYFYGILIIILTAAVVSCAQDTRKATETHSAPKSIILHDTALTREYVEIQAPTATLEPVATEEPTPVGTYGQMLTAMDTECPTETPMPTSEPTEVPEAEHTPVKLYFLATAYSSDPVENGGFGAVDCLYGRDLPADAIAADLSILPYGTRVYIDGIGERVVVDTAGTETLENMRGWAKSKKCEGWIDIYVGDDKAWMHDWGVRVVTLTILEWGSGR